MDTRMLGSAAALIGQILDPKGTTTPRLDLPAQKPAFVMQPISQPFPRSSPEAQGISSARIRDYLTAVENDETLDPHSIMILCNGNIVTEASFGAYDSRIWHITHSECKSITGLAIGMLIDEGKLSLEDKIVDIFANRINRLERITHKSLTIRHLLTMSSGILFNEAGFPTQRDWVKGYLESAHTSEPGKVFAYNSMNTYMLSAAVKEITGEGLMEYLRPRLWEPLGISNIFWETCPMGIEKGGWGLYICQEDIAKIGQLILQNGAWNGKQLVSSSYIFDATSKQIETPLDKGNYNYGYQIWVGRKERSFLFNGMFSQNVLGFFDSNILVVSNAGNNELFQQSNYYKHTDRYLGTGFRPSANTTEDETAYQDLRALCASLMHRDVKQPDRALYELIDRKTEKNTELRLSQTLSERAYYTNDDCAASIGLYPLYAQILQNNYTKGLKGISFSAEQDGKLWITIHEKDESYAVKIGLTKTEYSAICIHGEEQRIATQGDFTADENGTPVLRLRISFLELANTRFLRIYFYYDSIRIKWEESPGAPYLLNALESIIAENKTNKIGSVLNKADDDLRFRIRFMLEPEITAYPVSLAALNEAQTDMLENTK